MESKRALFKNKVRNIGLENYLYDNEVQLDLVETSKKEYSKSHEDYELFYDEANDKNNVLVPVYDIKGIQRVVDFTWFNILEYGSLGLPKGISHYDFNMNTAKFVDLLMMLEELNFKEKEQELSNLKEYFHHKNIVHYIRGHIDTTKTKKIKRDKNIRKIVYFSILPNGDIVQCAELGIVAGNIFEIKLSEILKNRNLYVCNPQNGCLLLKG